MVADKLFDVALHWHLHNKPQGDRDFSCILGSTIAIVLLYLTAVKEKSVQHWGLIILKFGAVGYQVNLTKMLFQGLPDLVVKAGATTL